MKQFFGAFFGSILGIIIATLLAIFITVAVVKSSFSEAFKEKEEVETKSNSILKLVIEGEIAEREKQNPFKEFGNMAPFGGSGGLALNTLIKKIEGAKTDKNVKGIYLVIKNLHAGAATVLEVRNSLEDFKNQENLFMLMPKTIHNRNIFWHLFLQKSF